MKKNLQLLILIGAPGSGKSTFAKYFLRTEENWVRVCRDNLRLMNFYQTGTLKEENNINVMADAAIKAALLKKLNVLVDATNCKEEYINTLIEKYNHLADINFKIFDLPEEILVERCNKRYNETGKYISLRVLRKFIKELEILKKNFNFETRIKTERTLIYRQQDKNLPKAIICDLDGTLALMNGRDPFDASRSNEDSLNEPVGNLLKNYKTAGYKILLVSGREIKYKDPTLEFLEKHNIIFDELWMRRINDYRKDSIIKSEIFKMHIQNKYFIEFVLDDRNQVVDFWRKDLKLPCFQVNYGEF